MEGLTLYSSCIKKHQLLPYKWWTWISNTAFEVDHKLNWARNKMSFFYLFQIPTQASYSGALASPVQLSLIA